MWSLRIDPGYIRCMAGFAVIAILGSHCLAFVVDIN